MIINLSSFVIVYLSFQIIEYMYIYSENRLWIALYLFVKPY